MARLEAIATGLYYPTPEPVVEAIAGLLRLDGAVSRYGNTVRILDPCIGTGRAVALLAQRLCATASWPATHARPSEAEVASPPPLPPDRQEALHVELYGVEPNRTRAQEAATQCSGGVLVASFFTTTVADASFSMAFVNPPYDDDYGNHGPGGSRRVRLEIQFLKRATHKLLPGGILVWIVPQARLAEAASYLASSYADLACWRFPDALWKAPDAPAAAEPRPMYAAFRQVVVLARRRVPLVPPDPSLVAEMEGWARQGSALPILPSGSPVSPPSEGANAVGQYSPYALPLARGQAPAFEAWAYDPDATARQVSLPGSGVWHQSTYCEQRWPGLDATSLGIGRPPMPLREGHLSLLVASGVANGLVVTRKCGGRALVKGGSIKERVRTTEVADDGTRRDIETERFANDVYLTSLETGELTHVVSDPGDLHRDVVSESISRDAANATAGTASTRAGAARGPAPLVFTEQTVTVADFLGEFGSSLMQKVAEAAPPIYLGPEDAPFASLSLLKRRPVGAQGLIAQAQACAIRGLRGTRAASGWKRVPKFGNVGEMSTGKTFLALATLALADEEVSRVVAPAGQRPEKRAFFPAVVLCPPIMVEKWAREARMTLPDPVKPVIIRALETRQEVAAFRQFDPTFHGKYLSTVGVAARVAKRISADLATWRAARDAALAAGRTPPRKPCHLVVLSHSTAKLGSAWSPRYTLRMLRASGPDGQIHLMRRASGVPYVVPCCPRCFAPLRAEAGNQNSETMAHRAKPGQDQDMDTLYLSEEQVLGERGARVKRTCAECGEALWQVVPEVSVARLPWRAASPPIATVDADGHRRCARRAVQVLPLPTSRAGRPLPAGQGNHASRRYPIADYLRKHHRGLFRTVIADEAHEFAGGETAQALALGSLLEACNPGGTLLWLTGTLFSGYASELFQLQRMVNDDVLACFGWHGHRRWMEVYGVERHVVITPPAERAVGAVSKRKEGREVTQELPGISPLMLRHILSRCVFVELADIAHDLPPLDEEVHLVPLGPVLGPIYHALEREATSALHAELVAGDRSALSSWYHGLLIQPNLPSRAITVRNAQSGHILAETEALPEETIWPKERELLRIVRTERAQGRRVLVYVEHTGEYDLLARLARLIEEDDACWRAGQALGNCTVLNRACGRDGAATATSDTATPDQADHASALPATPAASEPMAHRPPLPSVRVVVLRSNTCPPARREAWLARTVDRGCDVLLTHSACVQVGLDLVGFPTIICFETIPSTNRARQATRRSYRLGQTLPVRIIQLAYDESAEARLLLLVARKMRSSLMTEGQLPGEGLATYGEDEGDLMLQLARAVLDDVRHGAGRRMAGSLEAVLQEVRALDQQAGRFIAGERLEAALASDATGRESGTPSSAPALTTRSASARGEIAQGGQAPAGAVPLIVPSGALDESARVGESVRVTTTLVPSTTRGGRSWGELARELAQLKARRQSGQRGPTATGRHANGKAPQRSGTTQRSLWSERAGTTSATLWEATTSAAAPVPQGTEYSPTSDRGKQGGDT